MDEILPFAAAALHTDEETAYALISLTAYLLSASPDDPSVLDALLGKTES